MDQISTLYMLNNGFMINTICIFILKIGIRSFESTHLLFFQLKKNCVRLSKVYHSGLKANK